MKEKLFLVPGVTIGREGLPGKKLECREGKDYLEIEEKYIEILEDVIPFLQSEKKIITRSELDKLEEKEAKSKKSDARIALETEAEELEISFNTKTSNKNLSDLIEEKKLEIETDPEETK